MPDSKKNSSRKPDAVDVTAAGAPAIEASAEPIAAAGSDQRAEAAEPALVPVAKQATPSAPAVAAQPTAQVIDLDAVRADERRVTLAYVSEVHEVCALASRNDLSAGFIAKATPVTDVRRTLLDARAAEDEATAIRGQVRTPTVEPVQPAIDTAAIYAARNQNVR